MFQRPQILSLLCGDLITSHVNMYRRDIVRSDKIVSNYDFPVTTFVTPPVNVVQQQSFVTLVTRVTCDYGTRQKIQKVLKVGVSLLREYFSNRYYFFV